MIKVAIIDDGINEGLYQTGPLDTNLEVTPELELRNRSGYNPYLASHGTICAAIFKKYLTDEVSLISIKVKDEIDKGYIDQLIKAIAWCVARGVRIINISLGTTDYRDFDKLRNIINEAAKKGIIIIAAAHNQNIFTYPAAHSNVIGVKCDHSGLLSEGEHRYNHYAFDGIEITACVSGELTRYNGEKEPIKDYNSYAAPFITAKVCKSLLRGLGMGLEKIKEILRVTAINRTRVPLDPYLNYRTDWVDHAIIFNLSQGKSFRITPCEYAVREIIDIHCHTLKEGLREIRSNISRKKFVLDHTDTLIIIVNRMEVMNCEGEFNRLLKKMNTIRKNLVFLDDQYQRYSQRTHFGNLKSKLWCPGMNPYWEHHFHGEAEIKIPVITVFDYEGQELIDLIRRLSVRFRANDYYALGVADTCLGVYSAVEYLPIENEIKNGVKDDIEAKLNSLISLHHPDLIVLGVNAANGDNIDFKNLEKSFDIVIKIMKAGDGVSQIRMIANDPPDDQGQNDETTVFLNPDYVEEIYRYLIEMFNNDHSECESDYAGSKRMSCQTGL